MFSTIRRNPIVRAVAVLALALGLFAAVPATSGAAAACSPTDGSYDYASTMQLSANPTTTHPGETVVITGTGYPPNCELEVFVDGHGIGTATTNGDGTFTIDWHVPADRKAGPAIASTNIDNVQVTTQVQVVTSTTTVPPATVPPATGGQGSGILPKTGSQILPFLGGGVALLVIGSLLVLSNRKRGNAH